jgi:hypothetical protein
MASQELPEHDRATLLRPSISALSLCAAVNARAPPLPRAAAHCANPAGMIKGYHQGCDERLDLRSGGGAPR